MSYNFLNEKSQLAEQYEKQKQAIKDKNDAAQEKYKQRVNQPLDFYIHLSSLLEKAGQRTSKNRVVKHFNPIFTIFGQAGRGYARRLAKTQR